MTINTLEKITTGLTAGYVPNWTIVQGLKEAMQNIAYGAVKSGKPAKLYYDTKEEMWSIKDKYKGFKKRHLYIGESEQRNDSEGLGTFGEGWKIFLLVMARNNIRHHVATVGFTFWGDMEPTPHGTEVLVIKVKENNQEVGTKVYADVPESDWRKATESFAVLQGIEVRKTQINCILPERHHELWVQGVRIEGEESTNPLNLYYSYNLTQRDLINRDRSHVDTNLAYNSIKQQVSDMPIEKVKEYIGLALSGSQYEDIKRGPYFPVGEMEYKPIWREALAHFHNCEFKKLLIPSYNNVVNERAKKKGYTLLDTPKDWQFELSYLGIPKADDIIDDQYDVRTTGSYGGTTSEDKTVLAKVKRKLKKALGLYSISDLPEIRYVEEIINPQTNEVKTAHYDSDLDVIYLDTRDLSDEQKLFLDMLIEAIAWKFKAKTGPDFEVAYQKIIMNLLFKGGIDYE